MHLMLPVNLLHVCAERQNSDFKILSQSVQSFFLETVEIICFSLTYVIFFYAQKV